MLLCDTLCTALAHSAAPVRLAAANCLRQLTIALPDQRVPLVERLTGCLQQVQRTHAEAILGYSAALAGILAGSNVGRTVGIPLAQFKQVSGLPSLALGRWIMFHPYTLFPMLVARCSQWPTRCCVWRTRTRT